MRRGILLSQATLPRRKIVNFEIKEIKIKEPNCQVNSGYYAPAISMVAMPCSGIYGLGNC